MSQREKDKFFQIRVSAEEHRRIKEVADAKGVNRAEMIRNYVDREHKRMGLRRKTS